ncbi:MAG: carboxypeptidase regulatory-like domain-containing protein [Candidatus Hydrogenedentes bacterium]|nr:carboxypeptidase regulatory-like domain-containing protein [Candidatus Hydrogenedentota bacterium]
MMCAIPTLADFAAAEWWPYVIHATSQAVLPGAVLLGVVWLLRRRSAALSMGGITVMLVLALIALSEPRPVEASPAAVQARGYGAAAAVPEGFEYMVPQLEPGPYRVRGAVYEQGGAPATGVKVAAFRGEAWQWGYRETFTGEDGVYEIADLPDGAYNLIAVAGDALDVRAMFLGPPIEVEVLRMDLSLRSFDPGPISGTVVSKAGEPVEGAVIVSAAGWSSYGRSLALHVRTDREGRFEIPRWTSPYGKESRPILTPTLVAFAKGHEPGVLFGGFPEAEPLTLHLEDGVHVSGTVRFKDTDKPAPDIPVLLRGTPADNDLPDIITKTDAEGRFVFEQLCPFQYQLVIEDLDEGYTALEHPTLNLLKRQDRNDLDMKISHGATISGKVTIKETGEPIPGVHLWIPRVRPPRKGREAVSGSDGTYYLRQLPAGEYPVAYTEPDGVVREARPSDIGPLVGKTVAVGPDEQLTGVDFSFERGVSVSGRVIDQSGNPVKGARLHAANSHRGSGEPSRRLITSEVETAEDGAYRLWGLAPSEEWTYQLVVSAEGYGRIESNPFFATAEIEGRNFTVQKCARISGRVVDAQGRPVPTVHVSLKRIEGRAPQRLPDAISDVEGRFAMTEGAYPDTYIFQLCTLNMGFGPYRRADAANKPLAIVGSDDIVGLEIVLPDENPVPESAHSSAPPSAAEKSSSRESPESDPKATYLGSMVSVRGCKVEQRDGHVVLTAPFGDQFYIETKDQFRPPFRVKTRAMTDSLNLRLYYCGYPGQMIFNWEAEGRHDELRISHPKERRLVAGLWAATEGVKCNGAISPNEWHDIEWEIRADSMRVLVDGEERFAGEVDYSDCEGTLGIGPAWGSTVTVESFKVEVLPDGKSTDAPTTPTVAVAG